MSEVAALMWQRHLTALRPVVGHPGNESPRRTRAYEQTGALPRAPALLPWDPGLADSGYYLVVKDIVEPGGRSVRRFAERDERARRMRRAVTPSHGRRTIEDRDERIRLPGRDPLA